MATRWQQYNEGQLVRFGPPQWWIWENVLESTVLKQACFLSRNKYLLKGKIFSLTVLWFY